MSESLNCVHQTLDAPLISVRSLELIRSGPQVNIQKQFILICQEPSISQLLHIPTTSFEPKLLCIGPMDKIAIEM